MSAGAFTHRIHVQTRARNGKVQYPGGRASYTSLLATCAINPNYGILNYTDISKSCSKGIRCATIFIGGILDGGDSFTNSNLMYDGGNSNSNYTPILDGGNS